MGWWSTNKEGQSFAQNDGEDMVWGDSVADIIDDAIDRIVKEFLQDWGRRPTKDEMIAGFKFSIAVYGEDE